MRLVVADDDPVTRRLLEGVLSKLGFQVVLAKDGTEALEFLTGDDPPPLAILDWMMPGMTGIDVCRKLRQRAPSGPTYVLIVTSREQTEDLVAALDAGADDYVTKPFQVEELKARVGVGLRVATLQRRLADRVTELEHALAHVTRLQGLLPICMYCKKIRNDQNYWTQVETYVSDHSGARFSHSICPECRVKHIEPELERIRQATAAQRAAVDKAAP
ncbi:MAG TPA: response regulator transcription factor [Candidatus Acidoferrum sp.]|jgi:phosphoserine phosphatase RsbU/P|nr:response regulator transcription factor [Candidatus Acidoferrum sp.]